MFNYSIAVGQLQSLKVGFKEAQMIRIVWYYLDHVYMQFPLWLTIALYCITVMLFYLIFKTIKYNTHS